MRTIDTLAANELISTTDYAAKALRSFTNDLPFDGITQSTVGSFHSLAELLDELHDMLAMALYDGEAAVTALRRIAEVNTRKVLELADSGDWKGIATELQGIAFEAVTASASGLSSAGPPQRRRRATLTVVKSDPAALAPLRA